VTRHEMKRIAVLGSQMAYVDVGAGPAVLFLHGNPTSSYLWRDVIPHVAPHGRCIAPDLIGMGSSDKPDIAYRIEDHARYLEGFVEALGLTEMVLVLHDWGSALGLDWARRHPGRVRGLALMEFITPFPSWLDVRPAAREIFKAFRDPAQGRKLLIEENRFIEQILPMGVVRELPPDVMDAYRRPFLEPADREPLYQFPNALPIAGSPPDTYAMAVAYNDWLLETDTPKLFFSVEPGSLMPPERAAWYRKRLKACRSVPLGRGAHYVQEDHPDAIGREIAAWLTTLP
jgi:haloalkane dehalogenase